MNKHIVITGALGPKADPHALTWLARCVSEIQPSEIVCIEGSPELLDRLREVYAGPVGVHTGSAGDHDDIEQLPEFYDIAPGWLSTHGHRGQISLSRIGGNTAMGAARKFGKSVVMGHTHRLGLISESRGYSGSITSVLVGMEVGTLANTRGNRQTKNRELGFGTLTAEDEHVTPMTRRCPKPRRSERVPGRAPTRLDV